MTKPFPCNYCGRITELSRKDKNVCSNPCAVKYLYAKKHNVETPYETFLRLTNDGAPDTDFVSSDLKGLVKKGNKETTPVTTRTKTRAFSIGEIVEFINPEEDEDGITYTVMENKGDRVLVRANVDMEIQPTATYMVSDLKKSKTAKTSTINNPEKKNKHIDASILIGKYLKIYVLGGAEPNYYEITRIEITPENFENRDVTLTLDGGGFEKFSLGDYIDFLKHKEIEVKDSKGEQYILQLAKQKEAQPLIDGKAKLKELEDKQILEAEEKVNEVNKLLTKKTK
jgi:hypothetical protein